MNPHDFIAKWRGVELKERTASHSHFNDLCSLLNVKDPVSADPKGEWFTFEKGATKTGGGEGWADVWRKGCFAWEYKGKAANLDRAFDQLLRYSIALDSPPLLIVSDMERIRIHTNWTNTVQQVHVIELVDLADGAKRDLLRNCFLSPEALRPVKTRQMLTEEAARKFASLAQRLRDRGHEPHTVAHFVNRLVFCMFAEDVKLLPEQMFTRMLDHSQNAPDQFAEHARTLFGAMKSGGAVGFEKVEWFNGGLFDDDTALPLEAEDIENLRKAAKLDWSEIDPSILGTLFERGLDPSKRSQLGAHYTDRDKIMQIVRPVIIEPLEREWIGTKARIEAALGAAQHKAGAMRSKAQAVAKRTMAEWRERLFNFRVLDPACGSGNFLYLSLLALKDTEHRTNLEAEALGMQREFPRVGPENVLGIEINPYAAELARVSVWIGEIQWMRRNGFDASRNPILRKLANIECRDAVLAEDGTRAKWPIADVVIGNPPFLGAKKQLDLLGSTYLEKLRKAYNENAWGLSDIVCFWFIQAGQALKLGRSSRFGFVATNSVKDGDSQRAVSLALSGTKIFSARSDDKWIVDGASLNICIICASMEEIIPRVLDGRVVDFIPSDMKPVMSGDAQSANPVKIKQNLLRSFIGIQKNGRFDVDKPQGRAWISQPQNPNGKSNILVLKPLLSGKDITDRNRQRWIVDFYGLSEFESSLFESPFAFIAKNVKSERAANNREIRRRNWWLFGETMPKMRNAVSSLNRYMATSLTAKHRFFVWVSTKSLVDSTCVVIARDDDTTFGILHSRFHELWALRMGTSLEDRPRYTPSTTFETFPFPAGLTPNIPAPAYANDPCAQLIAAAAARLDELRENWLNPPDLVRREPQVVHGHPDRILPIDEASAKELARRTLTNLYNARPAWLDHAHRALDEAVADAYGWGRDFRAGTLTDEEILARLFQLNQEAASN